MVPLAQVGSATGRPAHRYDMLKRKMGVVKMLLESQAVMEIARFIPSQPSPEEILAFHASPEVAERAYELIAAERVGTITEEEQHELDSYEAIEHIMIHAKAEASKKLQQQAS